ncbi:CBS domain-containing protein [Roseomonas chloroacetimidivorans]|uniref:CBS domain-containing protein n=1 Tax=Roseomonas chloroacetimidivorans TaxID=1766656 RepID=UPI003C729C7B
MQTKTLVASDLMTREVVTAPPTMPVNILAQVLAQRGISAVPVVDGAGQVLGIVTEADLLRRLASAEDPKRGWLSQVLSSQDRQAERYARTHGRTVGDIMTTDVVAVDEGASAEHIAHLLEERGLKRVPVLRQGKLVGLVSRADLLRAVLDPPSSIKAETETEDDRILRAIEDERGRQPWSEGAFVFADVRNGVVRLYGVVRSDEIRKGMCVLANRVEGVKRVVDEMNVTAGVMMPGL